MIYKDIQIYIQGNQVIQINRQKAQKLYEAGYELFLHPCKIAFNSLWKEPLEISQEILTDQTTRFERWVHHYEQLNCNSLMDVNCRF